MERARHPIRRCAVHTRKSSEGGDSSRTSNSLHAQREACEAFIASQQGERTLISAPRRRLRTRASATWSGAQVAFAPRPTYY
jgi:hypothetical protein